MNFAGYSHPGTLVLMFFLLHIFAFFLGVFAHFLANIAVFLCLLLIFLANIAVRGQAGGILLPLQISSRSLRPTRHESFNQTSIYHYLPTMK